MNNFKPAILILIVLMFNQGLLAQSKAINRDKYNINITPTQEKISIDGLLNEDVWKNAEKSGKLQRVTPTDTGYAIAQTSVMIVHDESNLYVSAICLDPTPGERPILSLRRDFTWWGNDQFDLFFDTYNDFTNGYAFYVSAAGVQADGLIYDGNKMNWTWDAKWESAIKSYDDRWVVEIKLPLRSIRYFEGDETWGINFGRMDWKTNEKSAWAPMPRQFFHNDLAYTGSVKWDKPMKKSGLRFSLIPYIKGKVTRDNITTQKTVWGGEAGFDTKVMLSSSMNLDLTVNPDYSQVEEDRQQTNLDRFELFFPERRQFFLENSDLFADLGNSSARPFFSRRIGLNVPVNGGLRLSGRLGNKWRIGLMDMQTGFEDMQPGLNDDIPATNFSVAVLQRQVFSRSSITGFFINKEVTGSFIDTLYTGQKYNRVAGLEYNLASNDARWKGKTFYHQSFYPGASANAAIASGELTFSTRYFKATMATSWVGADYNAETGYIRRTGYFETNPSAGYTFYPSSNIILSHGPSAGFDILFNPKHNMTDRQTKFDYNIAFQNTSKLQVSLTDEYVLLDKPYDPTNLNGVKLSAGESFNWQNALVNFASDVRALFTYSMNAGYGSYYNGTKWNLNGSVGYRIQPYGSLAIAVNYNNISLPAPYKSAELILIGPRLDITFTDKLFLTTLVQYNNQINNLNTNVRLQWRYAPVSDLFIVYTDNSFSDDFSNKNRGLVLKLSYWFN